MNFKIIENGKEINCEIILTFMDETSKINYIVYTDGTLNYLNEKEIYASRYKLENNNYILEPIQNDSEWDLIDSVLEKKYKELDD